MSSTHAAILSIRRAGFLAGMLVAVSIAAFAPRAFGQASAAQPSTWAACDTAPVNVADAEFATFCADVRAQRSMQALSRRYSELWVRLAADQRSEFSVAERRWLSSGRFAERDACVAHHTKSGVVHAELVAAECLAQVTARRLAQVELRHAALQPAASTR